MQSFNKHVMEPYSPVDIAIILRSSRACQLLHRQRHNIAKTAINEVKQLYLERRYKQCAILCEKTLTTEASKLHPLHKTFFHFFIAICYESLGQVAHKYSSNKLPFLNLAQQAYVSAKNTLPLSFESEENGCYESLMISPAPTHSASSVTVDMNRIAQSPRTCKSHSAMYISSPTASSNCSHYDAQPWSYSEAIFDDYSPRSPLKDINQASVADAFDYLNTESSQTLHMCLKHETPQRHSGLAPRPLFLKKKATVADSKTTQRPLPSIPPRSTLRTTQRETAFQVPPLVNCYESFSIPYNASCLPASFYTLASPSLYLARYVANLSSFRNQLSAHLSSISDTISKTTILQKEHKAKQSKRLASYWMLRPATEGLEEADRKTAEKKERIDRLRHNGWRINKERFGWKGENYYRELRRKVEVELIGVKTEAE